MSGAPEADEYVANGGVRWRALARAVVGTITTLFAIGVAEWFGLIATGLTAFMSTVGESVGRVISAPYTAGAEEMQAAAQTAGDSLAILGPFAFPVAVVVSAATLLVAYWGVTRVV